MGLENIVARAVDDLHPVNVIDDRLAVGKQPEMPVNAEPSARDEAVRSPRLFRQRQIVIVAEIVAGRENRRAERGGIAGLIAVRAD